VFFINFFVGAVFYVLFWLAYQGIVCLINEINFEQFGRPIPLEVKRVSHRDRLSGGDNHRRWSIAQ
jgi:hypothetical protein